MRPFGLLGFSGRFSVKFFAFLNRLAPHQVTEVFLDQSNDQKVSLLENVKINRIESLYSAASYAKSLAEFRENSLTLRGREDLENYLENRQNNTRYAS